MGGEPTFVSMDDPDGEEWNIAALGPNKRRLAAELYHRLRKRYGAQGLVHFGQGKWYPGEQLPRWSLNCFWRADGEPIWRDEALIADETQAGEATSRDAREFLRGVAERLGLDPQLCLSRLRRSLLLPVARAALARQRRSIRFAARRSARTRAAHAHFHPRPKTGRWLCAAGGARLRARDVGAADSGFCAASVAISFPEIRPWAIGCRSIRCRGPAPTITRIFFRRIQRSRCRRLPLTRKFAFRSTQAEPADSTALRA